MARTSPEPRVLALGHSTRSLDELVAILQAHGVRTVADIRRLPGSRRYPHFDREVLERELPRAGIAYVHLAKLGGRRRTRAGTPSPNGAWRNASFRAYADHMQSAEFDEGLAELLAFARRGPVAMMCAEAVPWRCHRTLVADALAARGVAVGHVSGRSPPRPHAVTPFARISGTRVTYPPPPGSEPSPAPAPRRRAGPTFASGGVPMDAKNFRARGGSMPRDPNPPNEHELRMHQPPTGKEVTAKLREKLERDEERRETVRGRPGSGTAADVDQE